MECATYIGEENLKKLCHHAETIDMSSFKNFAASLDYKVGKECKQEVKRLNLPKVTADLLKYVLDAWFRICKFDIQTNGFTILSEKMKSCGLNELVEVLVDPTKSRKRESPKLVRLGLTIANTYDGQAGITETPGCKMSAEKMKESMEHWGFTITSTLNRTKQQILDEDLADFLKEVKLSDCDDIFIYFTGHGGYTSACSSNGKNVGDGFEFSGTTGTISEGGEYFLGFDGENVFKHEILKKILEVADARTRKIIIFDCCRGSNQTEMSNEFRLDIERNGLHFLKNSNFKNTYVFNATLPYQVAFVCRDITFFARQWFKFVRNYDGSEPHDISKLDEIFNAELKKMPARQSFAQAVELDKYGIDNPFYWAQSDTHDKDEGPKEIQPPIKKMKPCIIMGDGTNMTNEEFYEEHDWIDTTYTGAFQDDVDEVYEAFGEKPINFLSTFLPTDLRMRQNWSYQTKDGKEIVARTKASVSNFKYNNDFHEDKSKIPKCIICSCKYLMPNVYMFVYEHKDDDKLTKRMKYSESMIQACFYHFLDDGEKKGRVAWGQKGI